ncbi:MAG TPA: DUF4097 family beta strand repeat-containing protein, partial [Candidatus Polarisedimenticolaceae bacterium]|nr:DUF4097 family beta strand repeat-containing protein [Candidatus Polarisedimenticolaceae bacterium]
MFRRVILPTIVLIPIVIATPGAAAQQGEGQRLVVPISDPSRPIVLRASLVSGGIVVTPHDGREVIVIARPRDAELDARRADGMRLIPNTSVGVTAEEEANRIDVQADWSSRGIDLEIQVPVRTSAELSTVNSGDIVVRGLTGDLELQNTNGSIVAEDIDGSVVANTTNGTVRVRFDRVKPDTDMAFNSFNGDVDLTFPASLEAEFRISVGRGEIRTDFEAVQRPASPKVEQDGS